MTGSFAGSPGARASHASRPLAPLAPRSLIVTQIPAPLVPLEAAARALRGVIDRTRPGLEEVDLLWDPPEGPAFVGSGCALELTAERLQAGPLDLWTRAVVTLAQEGPSTRLFGGLAFTRGCAGEEPWRAFGDGVFVLPRLRYARHNDRAFLALALEAPALEGERRDGVAVEFAAALAALAKAAEAAPVEVPSAAPALSPPPVGPRSGPPTREAPRVTQLSGERWHELVRDVADGLRAGRFEKVVVARRSELEARLPFDPIDVVERLRESALGCTRFAFRRGPATFLGATPERLVAREGQVVRVDALAGSIGAEDEEGAAALLASDKDGVEHSIVVREIVERLAPRCESLSVPKRPSVRRLRHLLHLHTRIEGRLRGRLHVLDLVKLLHPTPAVGGVPAAAALRWILDHEPAARGWYAGPIGWFDETGDGDFAVALRSALIWDRAAWVWAGAGIVARSEAGAEYAETALKQRAMFEALGATG